MTATIVEMNHEPRQFVFRCPLTGSPLAGAIDDTAENRASPYFLFCITDEGKVFARRDELPFEAYEALECVIDDLSKLATTGGFLLDTCRLHTFVPGVIAHLLPDTALIFDLQGRQTRFPNAVRAWVVMDFSLPSKPAACCRVECVGSLMNHE